MNARFADAVVEEAKTPDPIVLVQDYHFALLPRMIRERLPDATIITFWHIPWPNPEAFAICPWREELLDGLLGSSILGFHTQFHCNNFLDTVDRLLEARVDRETFTVTYRGAHDGRATLSDLDRMAAGLGDARRIGRGRARRGPRAARAAGRSRDRRRRRPARLHEGHRRALQRRRAPARGRAATGSAASRSCRSPRRRGRSIDDYRDYAARVRALADRDQRTALRTVRRPPIILVVEHHEPASVYEYYRAADLCFVSSLHDGMNLVAKEFVAARDDEQGVLILSPVHRRVARAARGAHRQSVRRRPVRGGAARGAHDAGGRAARPHAPHARRCCASSTSIRWAGRMLLDAAVMRQRERFTKTRIDDRRHEPRGPPGAAARRLGVAFLDIDGTLAHLADAPESFASTRRSRGLLQSSSSGPAAPSR